MRVADLVEAEGRTLRRAAAKLGLGLALTVTAALLLFVGSAGLLAGLWLGLRAAVHPAWASVITGVVALSLAGIFLFVASRLSR